MDRYDLAIVEPVKAWLRSLRKHDPEKGRQIAARLELLRDGPGRHPRELVAALTGDAARSISLLEVRTHCSPMATSETSAAGYFMTL